MQEQNHVARTKVQLYIGNFLPVHQIAETHLISSDLVSKKKKKKKLYVNSAGDFVRISQLIALKFIFSSIPKYLPGYICKQISLLASAEKIPQRKCRGDRRMWLTLTLADSLDGIPPAIRQWYFCSFSFFYIVIRGDMLTVFCCVNSASDLDHQYCWTCFGGQVLWSNIKFWVCMARFGTSSRPGSVWMSVCACAGGVWTKINYHWELLLEIANRIKVFRVEEFAPVNASGGQKRKIFGEADLLDIAWMHLLLDLDIAYLTWVRKFHWDDEPFDATIHARLGSCFPFRRKDLGESAANRHQAWQQ